MRKPNQDIQIAQFLNHELKEGRDHKQIRKLFDRAREQKRLARECWHKAYCHPIIDPRENDRKGHEHLDESKRIYLKIHEAIETLLLTPINA